MIRSIFSGAKVASAPGAPFAPKQNREKVSDFYLERLVEKSLAYTNVITRFCADLYKGKITDNNSELKGQTREKLGEAYFKKGLGWERTEKELLH